MERVLQERQAQLERQAQERRETMNRVLQECSRNLEEQKRKEMEQMIEQKRKEDERMLEQKRKDMEQMLAGMQLDKEAEQKQLEERASALAEMQLETLKAQLEEARDDKHQAEKMYQLLDIVKLKPMKEAISYVDQILMATEENHGYETELKGAHRLKFLGQLDLEYMEDLGLKYEDQMLASGWMQAYRDQELECADGFECNKAFKPDQSDPDQHNPPRIIAEGNDWVKNFRARYSKNKKDRDAKTADLILQYMCATYNDFQNSEPPAVGFQRIVTKMCCMPSCEKIGICVGYSCTRRDPDAGSDPSLDLGAMMRNQDLPGGEGEVKGFFVKGGLLKPQKELEASPLQRLRLLLALQQLHYERYTDELVCGSCSDIQSSMGFGHL
jgi:hypothetical protein